jgi:hypothetical protein
MRSSDDSVSVVSRVISAQQPVQISR